jgi:uncharacterized protein (TIRG00374 family)
VSDWLKKLARPNVLLPIIGVAAAIAVLFTVGNPATILRLMQAFNPFDLLWIFLLDAAYEAVRFVQWWFVLRREDVEVSLKAEVFSFAGGEVTRTFPIGNYLQNYLLTVAEGVDFSFSSAATTLIMIVEVAVALTGLVVLGLGGWWWLRAVVGGGIVVLAAAAWLVFTFHLHGTFDPPDWVRQRDRLKQLWGKAAHEVSEFIDGAKRIADWRTVATSYALAACYHIIAAAILYAVLAGLGWTRTPFWDVLAVYFFSLVAGLIFPLPFGPGELGGFGALVVVGVPTNYAVSAVLLNRVLTILFSAVIAVVVFAVLRDELRRALQARGTYKHERGDDPPLEESGSPDGPHGSVVQG